MITFVDDLKLYTNAYYSVNSKWVLESSSGSFLWRGSLVVVVLLCVVKEVLQQIFNGSFFVHRSTKEKEKRYGEFSFSFFLFLFVCI